MVKFVNMGLKVVIYPDEDMVSVLEQNIGNHRFVWNKILERYGELYNLFKSNGYPLNPNISNLNVILNMLKKEYSFLYESESSSLQQVCRDLNKAFNKFFKEGAGYPKFKSKKNNTQSFRIQKNKENIKITNKRIRLAKIGYVHYRTSKKYKNLLKSSKINNITVKKENRKYYAIVNIKTSINELEKKIKKLVLI